MDFRSIQIYFNVIFEKTKPQTELLRWNPNFILSQFPVWQYIKFTLFCVVVSGLLVWLVANAKRDLCVELLLGIIFGDKMIRKRSSMKDICDAKRRKLNYGNPRYDNDVPSDVQGALHYIGSLFPREKFKNNLPPIVMRHQIYAFVKCRTDVDKELNELRKKGEVRLFKLGDRDDQIGVVSTKAYREYVESNCRNNQTVGNFLKNVVAVCPDIGYSNCILMKEYGLREEDIVELVQNGVLTCRRDVGCYWLSIPQVGDFMKTFYYGRRAVLQYVRRTKYKEISQMELEQRKLPRKALLGILYHVYDIIGSDAVTCIDTSTGVVLRLQPDLVR